MEWSCPKGGTSFPVFRFLGGGGLGGGGPASQSLLQTLEMPYPSFFLKDLPDSWLCSHVMTRHPRMAVGVQGGLSGVPEVLLGNATLGKLRFFDSLGDDKILSNWFGARKKCWHCISYKSQDQSISSRDRPFQGSKWGKVMGLHLCFSLCILSPPSPQQSGGPQERESRRSRNVSSACPAPKARLVT